MASIKKIVIVDYGLGNLFSVNQALINTGLNTLITNDPLEVETADALVLPGVGAFTDAMQNLHQLNLVNPIKDLVASGKPFLGICLGLQLLFTESEEFGTCEGLNIIEGKVRKFRSADTPGAEQLKVPQIAWNSISKPENKSWDNTPLQNIRDGEFLYFVHSYYVIPDNQDVILTNTTYGNTTYSSSVCKNNIFACQFHPEKSAREGLKIYKDWAIINNLL